VSTPDPAIPHILVDTREQLPWSFGSPEKPAIVEVRGLKLADYSLEGLTEWVGIERKSLADFCGSLGSGRERFFTELESMQRENILMRAVVVEASALDVEPYLAFEAYRRKGKRTLSAASVHASALKIHTDFGTPVLWLGNRDHAQRSVEWMLRRLWSKAHTEAKK
jgi:ERCC4-type nuclease